MKVTAIILAASQGERMCSDIPTVLHLLTGRSLIHHSIRAAAAVTTEKPVVVVDDEVDAIKSELGDDVVYIRQEPGRISEAIQRAEPLLAGETDLVLILWAHLPLITTDTLERFVDAHKTHSSPITMLTVMSDEPHEHGIGRVVRGSDGRVKVAAEDNGASSGHQECEELSAGVYCFDSEWLREALGQVQVSPQGDWGISELVRIAVSDEYEVQTVDLSEPAEAIRVYDRLDLAEAEDIMRWRINTGWMRSGVTIVDPGTTYIDVDVTIGQDTILMPNTYIYGSTIIGGHSRIGPNTIIEDTSIGNRCMVLASVLEQAVVEDDVEIGPFGHLRKGAHLARGVHMGNFGEVKNSYLGPGTKMGHFSYLGDATIEENVNIGAGTVTCNYDGRNKHPTEIGKNVFIGSDTMLVAPLKVGEGAITGAGAVVTRDVAPNTVVVGVPARLIKKEGKKVSNLFWVTFVFLLLLDLAIMAVKTSLASTRFSALAKLHDKDNRAVNRTMALMEKPYTLQCQRAGLVIIHFLLAIFVLLTGFSLVPILSERIFLNILLMLLMAVIVLVLESVVEGMMQQNTETWAVRLTPLAEMVNFLFRPFVLIMKVFHKPQIDLERKLGSVTEEELKTWVEVGQIEGALEQGERRMIYSIFHFIDTLCREIMIPRIDVFSLEAETTLSEAVQGVIESGHSRVPVYEDDIDNIVGLLYAKDLLRPTLAGKDSLAIRELLRPVYFVPEAKKIDELLREMQAKGVHIAVVVDEYGGMAGVVTLEDIVEEIVGEIRDEYDDREELLFQKVGSNEYVFHGRIDIEDFNDVLGTHLTRQVADTLGGFIYGEVGRVPSEGEQVDVEDWVLIVEKVIGRRIHKVQARKRADVKDVED